MVESEEFRSYFWRSPRQLYDTSREKYTKLYKCFVINLNYIRVLLLIKVYTVRGNYNVQFSTLSVIVHGRIYHDCPVAFIMTVRLIYHDCPIVFILTVPLYLM